MNKAGVGTCFIFLVVLKFTPDGRVPFYSAVSFYKFLHSKSERNFAFCIYVDAAAAC